MSICCSTPAEESSTHQQASITKGERASLDAAQSSLRAAISGLTESAREILGDRASRATLTHVAETLRAAATGAEGRELLARGRLTEELSETGWEIVAGLTPHARERRQGSLQTPAWDGGRSEAQARA